VDNEFKLTFNEVIELQSYKTKIKQLESQLKELSIMIEINNSEKK